MVTKKADYYYTNGLDRIEVDGSILPLRTGAARKVLKGEDLAFLAEALNERSLAANGYFALPTVGASQNFAYSRAEYESQFLDVVQSFSKSRPWLRTDYSALNGSTEMSEFLNLIDTSTFDSYGRLIGSKDYGPSRVDAIGAAAYHHVALTPSPLTAKIINVQDELDAYSNERKLTRFFRDYNFDIGESLPPFTVTSTGVDDSGRTITQTHTAYDSADGVCVGYQYNWGQSTYHSETTPITHSYLKSGFVWRSGYEDLQKVGVRFYNLPPKCRGVTIIRIFIRNRMDSGVGTGTLPSYVERCFVGGRESQGGFTAGANPKNAVESRWYTITDAARSLAPAWDPPFVHNDVAVPATRSQFNLSVSNKYTKYDCLEIYAKPIGAIVDLGDHTKWWTD